MLTVKRRLAWGFIALYLGVMSYGLAAHALSYRPNGHPLMYFIVWDMFCGWSPYGTKMHVIGEGESGDYYELAPGPWGEIRPWDAFGRHHYDPWNNHAGAIGANVLKHTQHEPVVRMFLVEEVWLKKWELADSVWRLRYDEPKSPHTYYRVRAEVAPDGRYERSYISWAEFQTMLAITDNPRLAAEASSTRPMFVIDRAIPGREMAVNPNELSNPSASVAAPSLGVPLGN